MIDIVVFFGLIASGKSTLAELFADREKMLYRNTDRVRKELAGLRATERQPDGMEQGIYTPEYTARTYQAMLSAVEGQLQSGKGVVLDGSYSRAEERSRVLDCGRENKVDVRFILCTCSPEEVHRRLELRARDPLAVSDGRWDIYLQQKENFEYPDELTDAELLVLETDADVEELLSTVIDWRKSLG